jgi:hypothetical protein
MVNPLGKLLPHQKWCNGDGGSTVTLVDAMHLKRDHAHNTRFCRGAKKRWHTGVLGV